MARWPHSCANGNRRPYASLGSRCFISSKHVPHSQNLLYKANISQHQPGPPTRQQPEPRCGAKTPWAPTAVVAHLPTTPAAMVLERSILMPTVVAPSIPMAAPHPTVVLQEEEAAPLPGTPPQHPPPTHTTPSPLAHPLTNLRTAAHPLPPTPLLKTQDLMMRLHQGKTLQQRRRRRHIPAMGTRVVRLPR